MSSSPTVHAHTSGPGVPPAPAAAATLGQMVLDAAARFSGVALQFPRGDQIVQITYPELGAICTEIARGLIALGIEPGDRVAILGLTSANWTLADCGSLCAGAVVTPIYHTNSPEECAYVLGHSESRLVFCDDAAQAAKIEQVRERLPALEHVVTFEPVAGAMTLDELRERGAGVPAERVHERIAATDPGDVATLVYTSGTTGPPKGCMLTHENFLSTMRMYAQQLGLGPAHSMYQFLPLAHVLARIAQGVVLSVGARLIYWGGDMTKIVDELPAASPTHVPAVPRIYEKIHGAVTSKVAEGHLYERVMFEWALRCGARARPALRRRRQPDVLTDLQYRLADRLVLSKVRQVFGSSLEVGLVGAAPIAADLLEFFDACGVLVLEGYGLTESCAATTINTIDAVRFGTVGKVLPGAQVAIADDGEILIRGPHVFKGYYKDPAASDEVLTYDGWLRTGDLGKLGDDGFLSITGRKKDIIITSSGKNVTPVNIESELRDSRFITEAVVYGDNRQYLVAMLTLDRDEAAKLAERLGIAADPVAIADHPGVRAEIQREVDRVNQKFARIEQIKRFAILDHDLTQSDGELTPTLKVKRAFVYEKYADLFARLYQ
ncbi:MAG TPA: long-chain fatty acid--CoA ligase [Solirubrobacteraceae bacterium]|nr:long-chain fatty acid--CoA ligase [Solirubrobacteraceae bacterium]